MRLSLASTSSTAPSTGSAPADRPVPAPRATTATLFAWHSCRIAATCASFSGSATTSGVLRYAARPSDSNGSRSSRSLSTQCAGSRLRNWERKAGLIMAKTEAVRLRV